ncbi:MAG: hypothetical protein ABIU97_11280, partial [Dehalococcoidia bacterium]
MALTVQTKIEENGAMTPWFLFYRDSSLLSVVDNDEIALPGDFIIQVDDRAVQVQDSELSWHTLEKMSYEDLDVKHADASAAIPTAYTVEGLNIVLRPV